MLDENLPTFFLKPNSDKAKHHEALYLSQRGSEPEPIYDLHHLDPASPRSKNVYAAALYDAYNPEVLFAEVALKPGWTQPSLSQEDIRKNGGIPPPPQPLLPPGFTLQLYNPDQQVEVTQKSSTWSGSNWYEFSLPQETFRYPSASALDRSKNDPIADPTTPKMNFMWKRESKLSKDMTCYLTGKSTDTKSKKKSKEPHIAVALFRGLKEITIYESNLYRVEMEDYKGLEVVVLLSAIVIRDVFFGNIKETFHINDPQRKNSGGILGRKNSSPPAISTAFAAPPPPPGPQSPPGSARQPAAQPATAVNGLYKQNPITSPSRNEKQRQSLPALQTGASSQPQPQPPPNDPRVQWEIDAEAARLRVAAEAQRREEEARRRQKERADEEEQRRIRRMLEAEDQERRRKQAEVDKETERLKRIYGTHGQQMMSPTHQPSLAHRHSAHFASGPQGSSSRPPRPQPQLQSNGLWTIPQGRPPPAQPPRPVQNGPYLQPPGGGSGMPTASQSSFFGGGGQIKPTTGQKLSRTKKSFWGLRGSSEGGSSRLVKKQSSIF